DAVQWAATETATAAAEPTRRQGGEWPLRRISPCYTVPVNQLGSGAILLPPTALSPSFSHLLASQCRVRNGTLRFSTTFRGLTPALTTGSPAAARATYLSGSHHCQTITVCGCQRGSAPIGQFMVS